MGKSGKLDEYKGSMQTAAPVKRQQNKVEKCEAYFRKTEKNT